MFAGIDFEQLAVASNSETATPGWLVRFLPIIFSGLLAVPSSTKEYPWYMLPRFNARLNDALWPPHQNAAASIDGNTIAGSSNNITRFL